MADSAYASAGGPGRDGAGDPAAEYGWPEARAGKQEIGYRDDLDDAAREPLWPGGAAGSGYDGLDDDPWPGSDASWTRPATPAVSRAVRGFAPAPGDPLPVYPPGPFAAWNRSPAERGAQRARGRTHTDTSPGIAIATITPDEFDTDYSLPAIKDPVPGAAVRSARQAGAAAGAQGRARPARAGARQNAARSSRGAGKRTGQAPAGRTRPKRQPVWLAVTGAIAIIAVGTVILVLSSGSSTGTQPKAGNTPTPAPSSSAPPAGRWKFIGSRTTDPMPLTIPELYPASFKASGTVYTRVRQAKSHNCGSGLIGSGLKAAVKQGSCTQAARATYVAHAAGLMATVGVFNLESATAAGQAATKAGHFNFVAQLRAKSGPASKIGQGTGIEEALFKGHYLVLVWAEYTNLSAPKNHADRTKIESFMNLLTDKTVNVGLSYRMVYGKPTG